MEKTMVKVWGILNLVRILFGDFRGAKVQFFSLQFAVCGVVLPHGDSPTKHPNPFKIITFRQDPIEFYPNVCF